MESGGMGADPCLGMSWAPSIERELSIYDGVRMVSEPCPYVSLLSVLCTDSLLYLHMCPSICSALRHCGIEFLPRCYLMLFVLFTSPSSIVSGSTLCHWSSEFSSPWFGWTSMSIATTRPGFKTGQTGHSFDSDCRLCRLDLPHSINWCINWRLNFRGDTWPHRGRVGDLWPRRACLSSKKFQQDSDLSLSNWEKHVIHVIHVISLSVEHVERVEHVTTNVEVSMHFLVNDIFMCFFFGLAIKEVTEAPLQGTVIIGDVYLSSFMVFISWCYHLLPYVFFFPWYFECSCSSCCFVIGVQTGAGC